MFTQKKIGDRLHHVYMPLCRRHIVFVSFTLRFLPSETTDGRKRGIPNLIGSSSLQMGLRKVLPVPVWNKVGDPL